MSDPVDAALALWGMAGATCRFVAGRENRVYKIEGNPAFALRFKRPGYREFDELQSELDWLAEMSRAGLSVPKPLPSQNGKLLERVEGLIVDVISWLGGVPMGQGRTPLALSDGPTTFRALGGQMARLHTACDRWAVPDGFQRCHWNAQGLLGETPLWGRFWENPSLDAQTREMLLDFRAVASRDLADAEGLDFGLIHADLVRENVLLDGDCLHLIDFDDGGYGFRLFDVATALLKNRNEPNYTALKDALIEGYRAERPLDISQLDLFLALRAVTYVGWIVPRMDEDGSPARNTRFIKDAKDLCGAYLARAQVN
jgi:Ser/Thr protein kinase RdoA (MazF antagonist)